MHAEGASRETLVSGFLVVFSHPEITIVIIKKKKTQSMHLVFTRYKDEKMQADFFLQSVLQKPDLPAATTASE